MSETASKSLFPGYRVFIYGQEVTQDVIAVTFQDTDGRTPNTCAITLVSPFDRYVVTPFDMGQYGIVGNINIEAVNQNIPIVDPMGTQMDISDRSALPVYGALVPMDDTIKSRVILAKKNVPATILRPSATATDPNPKARSALPYPFHSGKPIFHPNDPVRVFTRDPSDPNIWYFQFSGLVSDFSDETDANNTNILTITAESPNKWLRYGRFTANPGIVDVKRQVVRDVMTQDIAVRTVFANLFSHLTLPEIFFAMLFGISAFANPSGVADALADAKKQLDSGKKQATLDFTSELAKRVETHQEKAYSVEDSDGHLLTRHNWGIGHLNLERSRVFIYGDAGGPDVGNDGIPPSLQSVLISNLETYQSAIDHTVQPTDLKDMRSDGVLVYPDLFRSTAANTDIPSVITYIGQHPEIYAVDGGRLMMLIPRSLGQARRTIVTNELVSSFNLNTEWSTRGDVLYDVVQRIQFVFYVSPKGDFCVEFPLFDASPEQFGKFAKNYLVGVPDTTNVSSQFSDTLVMTQAVCSPVIIQNMEKTAPDTLAAQVGLQQVVTLWHLIPLYGVRNAPITPRGYIATTQAAQLYAMICLNRLNADSYTQKVTMNPRMTAWLNRPFYIQRRNHIGTTRTISHNITWGEGGTATTDLGLASMRGWDGSTDKNGRMIFTPIGGKFPLAYDILFQRRDINTPNQSSKPPIPADGDLKGDNLGVFPLPQGLPGLPGGRP